jgi:DNA adenine methylase
MARYNTPLRYPGGKQRLAPFMREVIEANDLEGGHYAEPYAGGAGIAIELLLEGQVSHVHLNDSSIQVYAFWHSVINQGEELCRMVSKAALTIEDWKAQREIFRHPEKHSLLELGFATFYLNRCNRSGVLTAGVIGGFAQVGQWRMDARFSRNELIRRVEAIASRAGAVSVSNLDAEEFMQDYVPEQLPSRSLVYCDPPYYARSRHLYPNTYLANDHARVAGVIQACVSHNWVVSYDRHPDVLSLYGGRRSFEYCLPYSATRAYQGTEIFIFSDGLRLPRSSAVESINRALERTGYGQARG